MICLTIPTLITYVVLALIIVIGALVGLKRGFVRSVAGLAEYIIAFMIANRFYTLGAKLVAKIPFIAKMITDVEMPVLESGKGFFSKVGAVISYIMSNSVLSGSDPTEEAQAIINNYVAEAISKAISFSVIFIVSVLIMKLIVYAVDKFCEAPVLKFTNKTLGVLFGIFCGMFITWVLSNVFINNLLPVLTEKYPGVFDENMADNVIMQFFLKFSPVALVMYVANLISSIGVK